MIINLSGGIYNPPAKKYFSETFLPKMWKEAKVEIKREIQEINGIGLTTDAWTSIATESYITYTAHYITKDWELKQQFLLLNHKKNLAKHMKSTEQEWGIDKLVFDPVSAHDNENNITKALKVMETPRLGISCFAHTLNLAASSATNIDEVSTILDKARRVVTTFKKSDLANRTFKKS